MTYRANMKRELLWIIVAVAIAVAIAMIVGWSIGLTTALPQPQGQAQGNVTVIYDKGLAHDDEDSLAHDE
jgi:type III secretory pathway component EscS